ncbi:hypothetical protein ABIA32_000457 [Streptacidiphilus sp. MAP12-20]|uniref:hypothetical protein n=1 Tax=Streptacidiphilus sp. MAP12-20 TaxID=3156299 RepID=UPI00351433F5
MVTQGAVPDSVFRVGMLSAAAVAVPAASALVVSAPLGRFTAIGGFIGICGLACLGMWWQLRPRAVDAVAARWVNTGAVLTVVTIALVEGGLVLFLGRYPDDPLSVFIPAITVGGTGVLCLVARIAVGVRARATRRLPSVSDRKPPLT